MPRHKQHFRETPRNVPKPNLLFVFNATTRPYGEPNEIHENQRCFDPVMLNRDILSHAALSFHGDLASIGTPYAKSLRVNELFRIRMFHDGA